MAVDLNDDNSLNEKAANFWEKNKKYIIFGVILFVAIYFSTNFYFTNQKKSHFVASEIYQKIQLEFEDGDISSYVTELKAEHGNSPYAGRASLILAQSHSKNNKVEDALVELDWVINNSFEQSIKSLALYSKAKLYLMKNELEQAEKNVNLINTQGYEGLKNIVLGDIYLSRKNNEKALEFYQLAFNFYVNKNNLSKVIKTKIDAIGN
jgi:predicted negative regulator of RcsB-dependent stress response